MEKEKIEIEKENDTYKIKCPQCGKLLAYLLSEGRQFSRISDCDHFVWHRFGNLCWSNLPCRECLLGRDELLEQCNSLSKKIEWLEYDGTNVWVLVRQP
ncbi:MAG: hypothetical protein ACPLYF_04600 [Fervidobacterium sp.]